MSEIEKLIQELCPNGVPFKKLGEIGTFIRGNGLQKKDFTNSGFPCIHYGQIHTSYNLATSKTISFISEELAKNLKHAKKGDLIIATTSEDVEGCCKAIVWLGVSEVAISGDSYIYRHKQNPKFISYIFQTESFLKFKRKVATGTKVVRVSGNNMANFEIPVPPMAVQEKIVEILDNFTSLTAELEARKRQYEYYRNLLLTFNPVANGAVTGGDQQIGDVSTPPNKSLNIRYLSLDGVFEIRNGYTPSKANNDFWVNGTIPWFRMEDIRINGRILSDSFQHITPKAIKGKGLFETGSFIIATTATIGEHAMLIVDSLANQQFTNLKIRESLKKAFINKFLYYYLFIIGEQCRNAVNVSGFASVDMNKFKKFIIPIPPLDEQERIVGILDKFEVLVNDLRKGLPVEIEARRKQYEYYRNKLLTFKKIA